jgi:hypothetical protein
LSYQQPNQPQQPAQWGQQPQWGQGTPGPQWGAPRPPEPKNRRGLKITLGVVGGIIAIGVIANLADGGKKDDSAGSKAPATKAAGAAPTTAQAPAAPATKAAAPAQPKPKPKPTAKTVLTESGDGVKSTVRFTVHGDWDLHYTYNCANFGMQGNFAVTSNGGDFPDVLVNELGKKGSDVTHVHDGGTLYLDVNSECNWTIKAVDIP